MAETSSDSMGVCGRNRSRWVWRRSWNSALDSLGKRTSRAKRPWRRAFCEERALPSGVTGPRDLAPLARSISARARLGGVVSDMVPRAESSTGVWGWPGEVKWEVIEEMEDGGW